jgi:hypothetical protein
MTLTGTIETDFYASYLQGTSMWRGIMVWKGQVDINTAYKVGGDYSKSLPLPTTVIPSGTITGKSQAFNELGDMIQCFTYMIKIRRKPG